LSLCELVDVWNRNAVAITQVLQRIVVGTFRTEHRLEVLKLFLRKCLEAEQPPKLVGRADYRKAGAKQTHYVAVAVVVPVARRVFTTERSADVFVDIGRDLLIFPGDKDAKREPPLIEKESFEKLGALLLKKIVQAASDGSLESTPHFWNLLRVWKHFDRSDKPKHWMGQRMMDSPSFMLGAAQGLLGYSVSAKGKSYRFAERPDTALYDFKVIHDAAKKHLLTARLNDDERKQLEALIKGAEAMTHEQPPADTTAN